jgi:hypothetical protein
VVKTAQNDEDGMNILEVVNHFKLYSRDKNNCIAGIRGWSVARNFSQDLHMYLLFAPFGSLHGLVTKFVRDGKFILEVFIWLVIRNLARACSLCKKNGLIHPDISKCFR